MKIATQDLTGKVAVVTGASRGIGKGIALALGERGATVIVSGRTVGDGERTIDTTARLVTEAGGKGIDTEEHGATLSAGTKGMLHGNYTYIMQDKFGQIEESYSRLRYNSENFF